MMKRVWQGMFIALLAALAASAGYGFSFLFISPNLVIVIGPNPPSPNLAPPYITAQPVSVSTTMGNSVVFVAGAAGGGRLFYQWRKNGANLLNAGRISGTRSNTLRISRVNRHDAGEYRVYVANGGGWAKSRVARLRVVASG